MPLLTALPKHMQISESLIRDIQAGRLLDGERLPPERAMAASLGTSVGTLRKALGALEDKGFLRRVQGSGNYVKAGATEAGVYALFRLERPEGGGLPRAELIDARVMAKPGDLPQFGASDRATRIRRLRFLDNTPVAAEEIWLDAASGTLNAEQMSESLYRTYQNRLGLWIARAEDRVHLNPFPDWTPAALARPGEVAGYVERWARSTEGVTVEYSRTWFHGARARYVQRLR
ncbi:GntR family transcriptional regulator [Tropicimonas sp. S265A]|uniref:GntR family transcriptional regulator n=1 Tax=Tropicimonas sp. S265A TaxID=3415134 RepID=UPI003C7E5575